MPARKGKTGRAKEREREAGLGWHMRILNRPQASQITVRCVFVCVAHGEAERIQNRKETNWELGKKAKQNEGSSNFSNEIMHS